MDVIVWISRGPLRPSHIAAIRTHSIGWNAPHRIHPRSFNQSRACIVNVLVFVLVIEACVTGTFKGPPCQLCSVNGCRLEIYFEYMFWPLKAECCCGELPPARRSRQPFGRGCKGIQHARGPSWDQLPRFLQESLKKSLRNRCGIPSGTQMPDRQCKYVNMHIYIYIWIWLPRQ